MDTEESIETSTTIEVDQEAIFLPTEEKFLVVVPETQLEGTILEAWAALKKKCTVRVTAATAAVDIAAVVETRVVATVVMTVVASVTEIAVALIEEEVAIEVAMVEDSYKAHVCQLWLKARPLSCTQIISDSVPKTRKDSFSSTK